MRSVGLVAGVVLVCGAAGADAQTPPDATAPAGDLSRPAPARIDGYDVTTCAQPGQQVTVRGRGLAPRGRRQAVFGGRELHIDLPALRWQDTSLIVTLPRDRRLAAGQRYFIGIEDFHGGPWASNTDQPLVICPAAGQETETKGAEPVPERDLPPGPSAADRERPSTPPDAGEEPPLDRDAPAAGGGDGPAPAAVGDDVTESRSGYAPATGGAGVRAAPLLQSVAQDADDAARDTEPDELLVWHADLDAAQAFATELQALGYSVRRRQALRGLGVVQTTVGLPPGSNVAAARERLRTQFPDLLVDGNHRYRPLEDRHADAALRLVGWSLPAAQCATDKRVGIVDSDVETSHPLLTDRDLRVHRVPPAGVDMAGPGHGTAVAARLAQLLPGAAIRVAAVFRQREPDRADTTAEWLLFALDWLLQEGVEAVNLSLGGPDNRLLAAGIERVADRGSGIVAAVGDGGADSAPVYPAAWPRVIGVTAVGEDLRVYRRARHGEEVDLSAPGVDVLVTQADGTARYLTGTSHAAPFVTAAWLLAGDRNALFAAAQDLGEPGRDPVFGAGLIRFEQLCGVSPPDG